ncbi:MAG: DUF3549 family protein [Gammaproteobacteria bacterium]|nr:DUF3549 family protein [Gammaproteobacteria bacterium]
MDDAPAPLTLLRLLEHSGQRVYTYDMGRRIGRLPAADFALFEAGTLPYPRPLQRKAWFAVVQVSNDTAAQPVIWFLRLSLDEQGLLVAAERDYLLDRLRESAQAGQRGADPQRFLHDNPHAFAPRDERMALFHARLSADLELPPSRYYAHALDYFRGTPGWDQWGFVGYQGIADVACRHAGAPLDTALARLPGEPLVALCHCLESQVAGDALEAALCDRLDAELRRDDGDIGIVAALARGLSSRAASAPVRAALGRVLAAPAARSIEVLAAISGRAWEALGDPQLLRRFLDRLADNDHGQAAFEHCLDDLLSLPSLADRVRLALRDDAQSDALRAAFAGMLQGRGGHPGD